MRVMVEVRGHSVHDEYGHDRFDSLEISILCARKGRYTRLTTTRLKELLYRFSASLYRHRRSGDYLLVIEANGGQHDHTQVYSIDPRDFQAHPLFDGIGVIYGDASSLSAGHVIEHSPDQYVYPKPADFKRRHGHPETLTRIWTYQPKTHKFTAGRYRADK